MVHVYDIPKWFAGYDITLEIIFALITGLVAFYAFKVYKVSKQRTARLFGLGFSFISASYISWAILNAIIKSQLTFDAEIVTIPELITRINNIALMQALSLYAHVLLMTVGLTLLVYITFKAESNKAYLSTLLLSIILLTFSDQKTNAFYLLATLFFGFIVVHYAQECKRSNNRRIMSSLIAFTLLFVTSLISLFFLQANSVYYVLVHILQLIAYILIANNLYSSVKHGQKKKSP